MSFELVPDPIIHQYRECCKHDATNEWIHFQSYITGYKNAMLVHAPEPLRHKVIAQLQFLWEMSLLRSRIAKHVIRRN